MADYALQDHLGERRRRVEDLIARQIWAAAAEAAVTLADELKDEAAMQRQASGCLSQAGDLERAIHFALRAVELAPDQAEYAQHLGAALNACGRFDAAAQVLAKAARLDPNQPETYQQLAYATGQQGNAVVASKMAVFAWRLEPENENRRLTAAHYLAQASRIEDAIDALRADSADGLQTPSVLRTLSGLLGQVGQFDEALKEIDTALAMEPATAEYHLHRSWLLSQVGRWRDALDSARRAMELDPSSRAARRHAVTVFAENGEIEEALRHGGALLSIAPHEPEYVSCMAYLIDAQSMRGVARDFENIAALKLGGPLRELPPPPSFADNFLTQRRSIAALVLRDIRSRYGESKLGFFWALMEPFIHVGFLALVFEFTMHGRPPLGSNFFFFYFTGVMPYLLLSHLVIDIGHSVKGNKNLLQIARVTPFDLMVSKAIVDVFMSVLIYLLFSGLFALAGVDPTPTSLPLIGIAFGLASLLGIGAGMICAALFEFGMFAESVVNILLRVLYFTSGIFYVAGNMPLVARKIIEYNPFLHIIDTMRMAYFPNYNPPWNDDGYATVYSLITLALGMGAVTAMSRRMRSIL